MATSIETIHEELVGMRKDLQLIKIALSEKYELSSYAKKSLKKARETSESKYVDLELVMQLNYTHKWINSLKNVITQ